MRNGYLWASVLLATAFVGCGSSSGDDDQITPPDMPGMPGVAGTGVQDPGMPGTAGTGVQDPGMPTAGTGVQDPGMPTAGTGVQEPDMMAGAGGGGDIPDPNAPYPSLRGSCGDSYSTPFQDDDACIEVPAEGEGIQLHVGPESYTDMAVVAPFLLQPGQEVSQCWTLQLPNTEDLYYQSYVVSGRAGTHHIITNHIAPGASEVSTAFRTGCPGPAVGTLPGASKNYMPRDRVAPEFEDVAFKVPANAMGTFDMHYYNFTDDPILREAWYNLYTAPSSQIKRTALQMRGYGGLSWTVTPILPGTDKVYSYSHPISGDGFIMNILGHYHAHGKKFTASITRKGTTTPEKVFEMYSYMDPAIFQYNSVVENPEFSADQAGAYTGILEVKDGDVVTWDCHIVNDGDVPLTYTNQVQTGEMCNMWGYSVGINKWDVNIF